MTKQWYKNPFHQAFLAILVLYGVVAGVFFMGLTFADDFSYVGYAWNVGTERFVLSMDMDFRALRLPLILPTALFLRLFGLGEIQAIFAVFLYSLGTLVLVYALGTIVGGGWTGLFSAALFCFIPASLIYGTTLLPDMIVPFWFALSVFFLFYARTKKEARHALLWYSGVGLAMFMAFLARVNSFYFFLFFLPFILRKSELRKGSLGVFLGFGVGIIALYSFYFIKTGDFLFNVHLIMAKAEKLMESGYIAHNDPFRFFGFAMPFFRTGIAHMRDARIPIRLASYDFGYSFYLVVLAAVYFLVKYRKSGDMKYILWWFFIAYAFLEYGTVSLTNYQTMAKRERFLATLSPPAAILLGAAVTRLLGLFSKRQWKPSRLMTRKPLSVGVWIILLLFGTSSLWAAHNRKQNITRNVEKFRWGYYHVLKTENVEKLVTTGGWWPNKMGTYLLPEKDFFFYPGASEPENMISIAEIQHVSQLEGCHLIVDDSHFTGRNDLRVMLSYDELIPVLVLPPSSWRLLGERYGVEIYYIPPGQQSTVNNLTDSEKKERTIRILERAVSKKKPGLFFSTLSSRFKQRHRRGIALWFSDNITQSTDSNKVKYVMDRLRLVNEDGRYKVDFDIQFK